MNLICSCSYLVCHFTHQKVHSRMKSPQGLLDLFSSPPTHPFIHSFTSLPSSLFSPCFLETLQANVPMQSFSSEKVLLTSLPWVLCQFSPKIWLILGSRYQFHINHFLITLKKIPPSRFMPSAILLCLWKPPISSHFPCWRASKSLAHFSLHQAHPKNV